MIKDHTEDSIIWPDLVIRQKRKGYRFSMDAVILSRLIRSTDRDEILDIGTGCGVVPLIVSRLFRFARFTGIEIQTELYQIARKNVEAEGLEKVKILNADIRKSSKIPGAKYDIIISNPPYFKIGSGRLNSDKEEIGARHERDLTLEDLIRSCKNMLKPKGQLYLIYIASRQSELFSLMERYRIPPKLMIPIYPKSGENADLIWVKGINGSKSDIKVLTPLFVYGQNGKKTAAHKSFYNKTNNALKRLYPEVF